MHRISRVVYLFISNFALALLTSCGVGSQTSSKAPETLIVKVDQTVTAGQIATLTIDRGSANGASISLPGNSLPNGVTTASASLDKVVQPTAFSEVQSSQGLAEASASIEVVVRDQSGSPIQSLANPMTIAIPYTNQAALTGWNLNAPKASVENLCAFLLSSGDMFIWRASELSVDSDTQKVSFTSKRLGVFQLFYCGTETVQSPITAGVTTPVKEAVDEDGVIENKINMTLRINSAMYSLSGDHYCAMLTTTNTSTATETVAIAATLSVTGTDVAAAFVGTASDLSDAAVHQLVVWGQTSAQSCVSKGAVLSEIGVYINSLRFPVSKSELTSGDDVTMTLGEGALTMKKVSLTIGPPAGSIVTTPPVKDMCLVGKTSANGQSQANITSDANGKLNQDTQVSFFTPIGANAATPTYELTIGAVCGVDTSSFDANSDPYVLKLKTPVSETFHIIPVDFAVNPTGQLSHGADMCLRLFSGSSLGASDIQLGSKAEAVLSDWKLKVSSNYILYFPWDTTTMSSDNSQPVLDLFIVPSSTCPTADDAIGLLFDNKELTHEIHL